MYTYNKSSLILESNLQYKELPSDVKLAHDG